LRVGDSLDIVYGIDQSLHDGDYQVKVMGFTRASDAKLHAELRIKHASGSDALGTIDSGAPVTDPALNQQVWIDGAVHVATVASQSGDQLILHLDYVGGSADFFTIETSLSIP
jgi:hypothetical protein